MQSMIIGQAAKRSGLSAETIRFYEEAGVLPRPRCGGNGYRLYAERDLAVLQAAAQAREIGMSLDEIKKLTRVVRRG